MVRASFLASMAILVFTLAAPAQTAGARFQWQTGQVLSYRVEHVSTVFEIVAGNKVETKSKLNLTKRWQVLNVDGAGTATVLKSLTALRIENTTPSGEVLLFDSANLEASNPQMRTQLSKYVNQLLAILRINNEGQVVEVKECKFGSASRFESEPPFLITLPTDGLQQGQTWERNYQITLEPPAGTGEKYGASQKYVCKSLENGLATVGLSTTMKSLPMALADQIPILEMQPIGEVVFDTRTGCVQSVQLRIEKELKDHQGEGSLYRLRSSYSEKKE